MTRSARAAAGVVGGALIALAACTGNGADTTPTPRDTGQTPATRVTVTETEFELKLSRDSFSPGTYTFVADNAGQAAHSLAVSGPGVTDARTQTLTPGGTAELTVTLRAGNYRLWCPVEGHASLGMDTDIRVGGTGGASPTGTGTADTDGY